ncbi:PAS domain-containing protein [Methanocalculus taiwanensis]|nr:PAS domain S-box protein [Methanocalculus taiwanensis]
MGDTKTLSYSGKGAHSSLFIRLWVFSALTVTAYLITYHGIQHGIHDVYPALFLIPIVFTPFLFPKRETIIAVAIALGYFALVFSLAGNNASIIYASTVNFIVFIAFGVFVAVIADHVRTKTGQFSKLLECSESCNWIVDRKTRRIIDINPLCVSLLDYLPHSLHGAGMQSLWRDHDRADALLDEIERSVSVTDHEEVLIGRDGIERVVRLSGSLLDEESVLISAVDITPLRNAEMACQNTRIEYKETLDSIDDPIIVIGPDHHILLNNRTALRQAQKIRGVVDLIGKEIVDFFPCTRILTDPHLHDMVFSKGNSIKKEVFFEESGVKKWYTIHINPIRRGHNSGSAIVIINDITEKKNNEALWRKSESANRTIFENAGAGILIIDEAGAITSVNDEFCTLTGYEKEELHGKHLVQLLFPKNAHPIIHACLQTDSVHESHEEYEVKIIDAQGEERDCMLLTAPIPDTRHRVVSIIDITEEQRMLDMILEQEANYLQLIRHVPVGIFTFGNGILNFVNPTFCQITGYAEEELLGEPISIIFSKADQLPQKNTQAEIVFSRKDGQMSHGTVELRAFTSDGEPVNLGILIDISLQKHLEEILRGEIERRSDFVMVASHELRTPLQPVVGYLDLILSDPDAFTLSSEVVDMLTLCQKHIDHERKIIDRMIALSLVDSGKIMPHVQEISLRNMIEDLIIEYNCRADAVVRNEVPPSIILKGDPDLLYHVFNSMILNAVRYNEPPREVSVEYKSDETDHYIRIIDNGVGIDAASLENIFKPFHIADLKKLKREYNRLGLGLSIAQRYVQVHGGEITVTSVPGEGSIFTIRIPMRIVR